MRRTANRRRLTWRELIMVVVASALMAAVLTVGIRFMMQQLGF
jgi:hypothetical protein